MTQNNSRPEGVESRAVALTFAIFALGFLHTYSYKHFQPDDAFIYLVYVKSFLNGAGLTFNGALVEGYSSVLWTVVVAFFSWLGLDPLEASKWLGWAAYFGLGALIVTAHRVVRGNGYGFVFSLALYFAAPTLAMWAAGAMETVLFSALIALAAGSYFYARIFNDRGVNFLVSGFLFGLVSLTRPEGFAFIGAIFAFELMLVAHGRRWNSRGVLFAFAVYALLTGLMFIGRWLIYGKWFPATVGAKTGNLVEQMQLGSGYILGFLLNHVLLVATYLISSVYVAVSVRRRNVEQYFLCWMLAILISGCLAFNWLVGGDWMLGWRFITPIVPFLVLTIGIALSGARGRIGFFVVLVIVASLGGYSLDLHKQSVGQAESDKGDILMGKYIDSLNISRDEKIAVIDAGAIPYFSGLPTIDMVGLNDSYLSTLAGGFLQKFDNDYVLENKPKIVQFHTRYINDRGDVVPTEAFRGALVLFYTPEFQRWYERDRRSPVPHLFVRRDRPLDRTFLDTYFDAKVAGDYQSGVLRIRLEKTGDGVWVAQREGRAEAGAVYLRVRMSALNGRLIHEAMVPISRNMVKGDALNMTIKLPDQNVTSYRVSACPVLLGVRDFSPCLNGQGYEYLVLDQGSSVGLGKFRFDDERLGLIGWSTYEAGHVWSLGLDSVIRFNVNDVSAIDRLSLDLVPFGEQRISVELNGVVIYEGQHNSAGRLVLPVAGQLERENVLRLHHPDAKSPGEHDQRVLALALRELVLE
ncbi:hypothetical protein U5817_21200 [Aromatoleum evansii]|uniref:Glycosyltransferase RgtA/B/C/D-like domain-containing protein n=1 Tax=Aromatoleum evansii TaxID=59406 RepID=A0ABZ1AIJ3_AROEV|nr:hypothetical protein U5817_21200 [Aromatoleum evansii]